MLIWQNKTTEKKTVGMEWKELKLKRRWYVVRNWNKNKCCYEIKQSWNKNKMSK